MKKRIMKYILYKFIRYIPSTQAIAVIEAKKLQEYISTNFDLNQQLILVEELKQNLIIHRENEIEAQKFNIEKEQNHLVALEKNHLKLIA